MEERFSPSPGAWAAREFSFFHSGDSGCDEGQPKPPRCHLLFCLSADLVSGFMALLAFPLQAISPLVCRGSDSFDSAELTVNPASLSLLQLYSGWTSQKEELSLVRRLCSFSSGVQVALCGGGFGCVGDSGRDLLSDLSGAEIQRKRRRMAEAFEC